MIIANRQGHTKASPGASDILNEIIENEPLLKEINKLLIEKGHKIVSCYPGDGVGGNEWNIGVTKANNSGAYLFFSIHFNSTRGAYGCEILTSSLDKTILPYANKILSNLESLGFTNRGIKIRDDLAETVGIDLPAMIIEVCFIHEKDAEIYKRAGMNKVARAIANGLDNNISLNNMEEESKVKCTGFSIKGKLEVGEDIQLTATAEPFEDAEYKFWVCDRTTGEWVVLQRYILKSWATSFKPKKAGNYTLVVHVKHRNSNKVYDDVRAIDINVLEYKSQVKELKVIGEAVTGNKLNITASGSPTSDTLYKFWVCDRTTGEWVVISDYSSKNNVDYTAKKAGNYTFVVHVKHKNSKKEYDEARAIDLVIKEKVIESKCNHTDEIERLESIKKEIDIVINKLK